MARQCSEAMLALLSIMAIVLASVFANNICPRGFEGLKIMAIPRTNLAKQLLRF